MLAVATYARIHCFSICMARPHTQSTVPTAPRGIVGVRPNDTHGQMPSKCPDVQNSTPFGGKSYLCRTYAGLAARRMPDLCRRAYQRTKHLGGEHKDSDVLNSQETQTFARGQSHARICTRPVARAQAKLAGLSQELMKPQSKTNAPQFEHPC